MKLAAPLVFFLSACAGTVVIQEGSKTTKMSENVYAHQLSTKAFEATNNAQAECYAKAGTELGLAICGLSGKGSSTQLPQFIPAATFMDRVVQLAPTGLGFFQIVANDRANQRQTDAQVLLAGINANREVQIMNSATGSNREIATLGFVAVSGTATAGYDALTSTANTSSTAAAATAQAGFAALSQSVSEVTTLVAALPPTTQTIDNSTNSGIRVTGNQNETARRTECTALSGLGGNAQATLANSQTGTTNPASTAYNALNGAPSGNPTNTCGG